MTTTIDDVEEFLEDDFTMPDQVEADAGERAHISAQRIAKAIEAIAPVADDLDHQIKLKMLHSALDGLIADIPADERGPVETALLGILKVRQSTDEFMAQIPVPATGPVFAPYSFDDLLAMPPKEWLVENIFGPMDTGIIYGMPGCGKTFVVIDLIMAACAGSTWAMRFDVARPLNIGYCAGEGISGLPSRFKAAAHHHGITSLPNFTFYRTVPQLFDSEEDSTVATIRQFVTEWKARQEQSQAEPLDLIVIDTLHTATVAADENSAKDMGKVLHACRWAASELGCAIVLVHHTNKGGSAERGSSALRGACDFMIEVKRLSESGTKAVMHCSKLKDGEAWKDQTLDLVAIDDFDSVRIWWDEPSDGSEMDKRKSETARQILDVLIKTPSPLTAKQIGEALDSKPQAVNRVMTRLERDELVSRSQNARKTWCFAVTEQGKEAFQDKDFA